MKRKRESILRRCRLIVGLATMLSAALFADTGDSNRAVVLLRPDETSFWRTATNSVIAVPVDMPPMATSATLTVRGVKYGKEYEISSSGDFIVSLPPAFSAKDENVYDMTLAFNDGTVRRAKLGLVQGYAAGSGAGAFTRLLSPKGDVKWNGVQRRAVLPIPYGMTSLMVNGVATDTGLGGAQGWYALAIAPNEAAAISSEAGNAELLGLYDGLIMSFR